MRYARAATCVLAFAVSSAAFGQDKPADATSTGTNGADNQSAGIEDIVVTATRRQQRLQDVPISVTALSAKTLDAAGITATPQLAQVTPGLILARNSAIFQPTIRGVGSRAATLGDESNIAIYIDGIYQPDTFTGAFDLLEVERVEVLRGPQGTLFGRNATGGLINVITPDPSHTFSGNISARYGSFDEKSARGYVTGPITSKLTADLAVLAYDDNGYVTDLVRGGKLGGKTSYAARAKLMFEPYDGAKIILIGNFSDQNDQSAVAVTPIDGNTVGRRTVGAIIATIPNTAALTFSPISKVRQYGAALQSQWPIGSLALNTTTSYAHSNLLSVTDSDASPVDLSSVSNHSISESVTQEVRLTSAKAQRLQWIVGGFGYLNVGRYDPLQVRGANSVVSSNLYARNLTRSLAGFAEGTYSITDTLKLTVGGRYTWEDRHFTPTRVTPAGSTSLDVRTSYNQFTPRASLQLVLTKDVNAYVSYSKGFKSGVFSTGGLNPNPVRPEKLDAYEFGIKADPLPWLRANASVYYYDYNDIQVSVRDPSGVSILQNAAKATIAGGEAEITVSPIHDLNFRLGVALSDGTFGQFDQAIVTVPLPTGGNSQIGANVRGKDVIRSPHQTVSFGADYAHQFSFGRAGISGNAYYSGRYYWDYLNRLSQSPYVLVNGQMFVEPVHNLRLIVYVENLTDRIVEQNVVSSTLADYAIYNKPRTWGVGAHFAF